MSAQVGGTRRRILFLTPQLPNRTRQGAAIRNWNLMAQLATRHDLDLLTFVGEREEGATGQGRADEPWGTVVTVPAPPRGVPERLRTLLLSARADMADRLWSPAFARCLRDLLAEGRYDIVQGEGIELARYLLAVERGPGAGPLLVFDAHNAEYVLQRRAAATDARQPRRWPKAAYSLAQWRRLRHFERRLLRACDLTACVSEADAEALQPLAPERPLIVVPNGVDTAYYSPEAPTRGGPRPAWPAPPDRARFDLVFSGSFDYRPNIDAATWFVAAVWPLLRQGGRRPDGRDLRLALVGRDPAPEVTRLVVQGGVLVTGSVADDRPYFAGATVYILPMRYGGGVRLKLLNALAMGCAVVSTTPGAEGVPVRAGEHLLLADGAAAFAAAVERLLTDPDLRARLGAAGRAFVREHYDWAGIAARLEAGYDAAFAIRASPPTRDRPPADRPPAAADQDPSPAPAPGGRAAPDRPDDHPTPPR